MKERPTADLVVLGVTLVIGSVLILTTIAVIVIEVVHPDTNTDGLVEVESEVLGVLVGALVGFIGGRSYGRTESE